MAEYGAFITFDAIITVDSVRNISLTCYLLCLIITVSDGVIGWFCTFVPRFSFMSSVKRRRKFEHLNDECKIQLF